jgi:hypothetical protein
MTAHAPFPPITIALDLVGPPLASQSSRASVAHTSVRSELARRCGYKSGRMPDRGELLCVKDPPADVVHHHGKDDVG